MIKKVTLQLLLSRTPMKIMNSQIKAADRKTNKVSWKHDGQKLVRNSGIFRRSTPAMLRWQHSCFNRGRHQELYIKLYTCLHQKWMILSNKCRYLAGFPLVRWIWVIWVPNPHSMRHGDSLRTESRTKSLEFCLPEVATRQEKDGADTLPLGETGTTSSTLGFSENSDFQNHSLAISSMCPSVSVPLFLQQSEKVPIHPCLSWYITIKSD